ncbi:MAG: hypothetical protein H6986_02035 [Pseudomonadales bacterium]|nr:hypothetical protein [Pseudomonadales bacterium]
MSAAGLFAPFAVTLMDDLRYANLLDRGYVLLRFDSDQVSSEWRYVTAIDTPDYALNEEAARRLVVSRDDLLLG